MPQVGLALTEEGNVTQIQLLHHHSTVSWYLGTVCSLCTFQVIFLQQAGLQAVLQVLSQPGYPSALKQQGTVKAQDSLKLTLISASAMGTCKTNIDVPFSFFSISVSYLQMPALFYNTTQQM